MGVRRSSTAAPSTSTRVTTVYSVGASTDHRTGFPASSVSVATASSRGVTVAGVSARVSRRPSGASSCASTVTVAASRATLFSVTATGTCQRPAPRRGSQWTPSVAIDTGARRTSQAWR